MPTLDRLQATLGGPDFQVVALSLDRKGLPVVQEFYAELGLETLPIYVDESGEAQRALSVLGLPTTLLLDRDGNEVGRLLGSRRMGQPGDGGVPSRLPEAHRGRTRTGPVVAGEGSTAAARRPRSQGFPSSDWKVPHRSCYQEIRP